MTAVASPCVSICALDDNDVCLGCFRTAAEITVWGRLSDEDKRTVLEQVAQRERASFNFIAPKESS